MHRPIGTDSGYFWSRAGHSASFYGSDSPGLTAAVALHAVSALRNAGTALLVVTPAHRQAILASVSAKCDVKKALDVGALVVFDALETLDRVSFRGYPDPVRFQTVIARTVEDVTGTRSPVYAYGEMVGLLWKAAQYPAALRLEQLWNGLCRRFPLALHCGYPIDVLSEGFEASAVGAILHAHDRVLAGERAEQLATAVDRALGEILGSEAQSPRPYPAGCDPRGAWAALPRAEATILWLKSAWPKQAGEVLERARRYYELSA